MSKIRHQNIDHYVDPLADHFPSHMAEALDNIIQTSIAMRSHVDWSTLRIQEPEVIYAVEASGERTVACSTGLLLQVDSILIEDDK